MNENTSSIKEIIPISIGVAATYSIGVWGLYLQPQLLIPLMNRYNATETEIGQLYGFENLIYFIAILMVTVPVTKYSRTKMALLGTIIFLIGSIASAYATNLQSLMLFRGIVSIGGGMITGAGTAAASASPNPERTFALAGVMYLMIKGIGQGIIPIGLESYGVGAIYLSMAAYGIFVIPAYFLLFPPVKADAVETGFLKLLADAPHRLLAIFAISGLFIYELGQNAVFTFQDKLGDNIGIEAADRGMTLFISTVIGMLGGVVATWMGTRFGRFWPLVGGLVLNIGSSVMFAMVEDPAYYGILMTIWTISYFFVMPYLMGTLASLDREGRWSVAGDAFWNFSGTPGPVIATLIVTNANYTILALWAFTSGAVGMALFCYTAKQSDKLGLEG